MIICNDCNKTNDNASHICEHCGHTLIQFDCISGMPLVAGSCKDQLLNTRYIIESEISRDQTGCVYKAEDALDGSNVIIKTLPLSLELTDDQINQLKQSTETINSLFPDGLNHLKGFNHYDLVRYFVYDSAILDEADSIAINQNDLTMQLASESAQKQEALDKVNEQLGQLQKLKEQLEHDKQTYEDIVNQAHQEHLLQQSEKEKVIAELKSIVEIQKAKIQAEKASYEQQIEQLTNDLNSQNDLGNEAVKQAKQKIEELQLQQQQVLKVNTEKIKDYQNRLQQVQEQLERSNEGLDKQQFENQELTEQINKLNESLAIKESKLAELAEQISGLQKSEGVYKNQLEHNKTDYESNIGKLQKEIEENQTLYNEQLQQAQQKSESLAGQLERATADRDYAAKESEEKLAEYDNQIADLKKQLLEAENESDEKLLKSQNEYDSLLQKLEKVEVEKTSIAKESEEKYSDYDNQISYLKAQIVEAEEKYELELERAQSEADSLSRQLEQSNEEQQNHKQQHDSLLAEYETQINIHRQQLAQANDKHAEQLEQAENEIKTLADSLEKTEELLALAKLQKETSTEDEVEQLKTEALKQKADYLEQLEKSEWKIKALSAELEKAINNNSKSSGSPSKAISKFRFPTALTATAMAAGLLVGVGLTYFITNYNSKELQWKQQQVIALSNDFDNSQLLQEPPSPSDGITEATEGQLESVFEKEIKRLDEFYSSQLTKETSRVYLKAAQKGDVQAMYKLGMAYLNGNGTNKSVKKAILWLSRAADNENAEALLELGNMYYLGTDIPRDRQKALKYYTIASEVGSPLATYNVGRIHQEEAGIQAVQWYQEAAKQGLPKAMNQLAQMYYIGTFVKQDLSKTVEYYQLSAQHGDTKAMYNLASLYQGGIGVEKDQRKAMLWLIKAARMGDADSMYQLGVLFENGAGIQQDIEKALYWYQTASESGHKKAPQKLIELKKTS